MKNQLCEIQLQQVLTTKKNSSWRSNSVESLMQLVNVTGSNNYPQKSKEVRYRLSASFSTVGKVP